VRSSAKPSRVPPLNHRASAHTRSNHTKSTLAALVGLSLLGATREALAQCSTGACPPCESCRVPSAAGSNPSVAEMSALFDRIATGPRAYGALGWNFGGTDTIGVGPGCCDGSMATPCTSTPVRFPCLLLKAIYYTESGWRQFCSTGRTVISFDCGYGIAQVTSGMRRGETSAYDPNRVAAEPAYNVSVGAAILAGKWRAAACVGSNDQDVIEHWYFAVWGYNGFAFSNNPNNPAYRADRPEFNSSPTATNRRAYPYQELVWGFAHFPPSAAHYRGQGLGYPRRSEICASCGFPMASVSETPSRTPAACEGGAPAGPRFGAAFVMQSFPLARTTLDLPPNAESAGFIELRNTGSETWRPGEVFLATSSPRDRASSARGSDWPSPNRAATVDRVVAPMQSGRFAFSLRAPAAVGQEFSEFFGLVREGVTWFSDPGQGGPPDNQLQVRVRAVVGDAGLDADVFDAETPDASLDASPSRDGSLDGGRSTLEPSGCGCGVPARTASAGPGSALLAAAVCAVRLRASRRRPQARRRA
jgi:hypothetical protein